MSKNLDKKLLAEAFDAIVNDNDVAKATRLFKRHWDLAARNSYALLESADEDFEINDMGDDFNEEMADEIGRCNKKIKRTRNKAERDKLIFQLKRKILRKW